MQNEIPKQRLSEIDGIAEIKNDQLLMNYVVITPTFQNIFSFKENDQVKDGTGHYSDDSENFDKKKNDKFIFINGKKYRINEEIFYHYCNVSKEINEFSISEKFLEESEKNLENYFKQNLVNQTKPESHSIPFFKNGSQRQNDFNIENNITKEIIDHILETKELYHQEINNQEINNQEINNQEINNQEINNQEINNQEINNQEITDQEITDQEINNQEIHNRETTDQELYNQETNQNIERINSVSVQKNETKMETDRSFESINNKDLHSIIDSLMPFFLGEKITVDEVNFKILLILSLIFHCDSLFSVSQQFFRNYQENTHVYELSEIQRIIMSTNSQNYQFVKNAILDSCILNNLEVLVQFLLVTVEYRPTDNSAHCELIKTLAESIPNDFLSILTSHILSKFTKDTNFFFIHELMRLKVISEKKVTDAVCSSSVLNAGLWFAPEVEKIDPTYIETLKDRIMSISLPSISKNGKNKKKNKKLLKFFELTQKNNWNLHNEYSTLGFNPNQIAIALRNDDIDNLQIFACQHNFNINQTIKPCFFERSALLMNSPNLIQYSAFYGSIRCFKYLLLNGANIDFTDKSNVGSLQFAIAGGNVEIIRICQQQGCNFINTLSMAAQFHRYSIFDWLIDSVLNEKTVRKKMKYYVFNASIKSYNLTASLQCIENAHPNIFKNWNIITDAVECGNIVMTKLLFTFKDINFNERSGQLLSSSAKCGNLDLTKLIVSQPWFESLEKNVSEAINTAVSYDSLEVLKYLETLINVDIFQISVFDQNPFFTASSSGSLKCLKYLASKNEFDVNQVNNHDCIALRSAISAEQIEVVKFLLSLPTIDINARTGTGGTAFTLATWKNFIVIAKLLVNHGGVDLNVRGSRGETPLTSCIFNHTRRLMKYLLTLPGIDVNMPNREGKNPLFMSISENDIPSMKLLLQHPNIDVNYKNVNGDTPLIFATKLSNSEATELLLMQNGININASDNDQKSAIYYAAFNGLLTTIHKLLEFAEIEIEMDLVFPLIAQTRNLEIIRKICGEKIPNPNKLINNDTLLTLSCKDNNLDMIDYLLLQEDINPNVKNGEGDFPLLIGSQMGFLEVIKKLMSHPKIDINATNSYGVCALRAAVCEQKFEVVSFLLNCKTINVNLRTIHGGTAFSAAIYTGNLEIIKSFFSKCFQYGIELNNHGNLGETPLTSAVLNNSIEIVSFLISIEEVDINKENLKGQTPLMISAKDKLVDVIPLLISHKNIDINHFDKFGNCALSLGGIHENIAKILLVSEKINFSLYNNHIKTLESILQSGNVDNLSFLLNNCQFNLNCYLKSGDTPLVYAIKRRDSNLFNYLITLENALDFDFKTKNGDPPIIVAIMTNTDFALSLIPKCDINCTNFWGETPLIIAAKQVNLPIIRKLLAFPNIRVNHEGKRGFSAVCEAILYNSFEATELLIKHGAIGINSLNALGETSLITAMKNENKEIFQLLLNLNSQRENHNSTNVNNNDEKNIIDVNKRMKDGTTALICSMSNQDDFYAKMLLRCSNLDLNIMNDNHETALTISIVENQQELFWELLSQNVVIDKYALPTAIICEQIDISKHLISKGASGINNLSITGQRPLPYAIRCKNEELIHLVLSIPDVDINVFDEDQETALTLAVYQVNYELTKRLLFEFPNINVNHQNKDGETALRIAAANGRTEFVSLLLSISNINVNLKTKRGGTPLTGAVSANDPESVEMLLNRGAIGINDVGAIGETPLTDAIDSSNLTMVKFLLQQPSVDINAENAAGQTPLLKAIKHSDVDIVKMILSSPKVDVNSIPSKQQETPLTMSLYLKKTRISNLLLESPTIEINQRNKVGRTPLMVAIEAKNIEMTKKLLQNSEVDVNARDYSNISTLELAILEESSEYLKFLLNREDLNLFIFNGDGETVLSFCNFEQLELLLLRGKTELLNYRLLNGDTALIHSVKQNEISRVKFFLKYPNIDILQKDQNGNTAEEIAIQLGNPKMIELFRYQKIFTYK
ncbi:hypothetical protein TRFO_22632 [Tritrichomonas foetus]|uniref:DUF3447 domain-containing protein n=1 Tax=Tritrichomonas foetus TaxID=1144522 RepID=A0A1J4KBJ6_9EUKA|nr:hypothetical protein TRFO_22632 [Tritrichomonas foetus]|eukprot:OHT08785.1 hypothetical protein TRFO_22632 [Tritrichomonas foetus]